MSQYDPVKFKEFLQSTKLTAAAMHAKYGSRTDRWQAWLDGTTQRLRKEMVERVIKAENLREDYFNHNSKSNDSQQPWEPSVVVQGDWNFTSEDIIIGGVFDYERPLKYKGTLHVEQDGTRVSGHGTQQITNYPEVQDWVLKTTFDGVLQPPNRVHVHEFRIQLLDANGMKRRHCYGSGFYELELQDTPMTASGFYINGPVFQKPKPNSNQMVYGKMQGTIEL